MPTEKIYYRDAYQAELKTRLLARQPASDGLWLLPDQSIIYPGGGGQLADIATINGLPVQEIRVQAEEIWCRMEPETAPPDDGELLLKIDWDRRYYNMQQHSGQHLLSHVLFEKNLATVSVHLGEEYTLVEVEGAFPSAQTLQEAEAQVNQLIRKAIPVTARWVSRDELDGLPLRKPAGDWEELRVVVIGAIDYSACGGLHVQNTSEIGYIKIAGVEKIRGHARIKAYIGVKADAYFNLIDQVGVRLRDQLKVDVGQFPERVAALAAEIARLKKERETYRRGYIEQTCRSLAEEAGGQPFILKRLAEGDWQNAQDIARTLSSAHGCIACVLFERRFVLISPDENKFDPHEFLGKFGAHLKLKGGGAPGFVQGVTGEIGDLAIQEALHQWFAKNPEG
jgi:alanyl-tRNA synthetase